MNTGALRVLDHFEHFDVLESVCERVSRRTWKPTNTDYAELAEGWTAFHFIELVGKETDHVREFPEMLQVRDFFRCPVEQLMFYAVRPGTALQPHRDMSGNLPFGRLRFHVPIVTHPEVEFVVGGKRVDMRPGELWALDTSYEHSVRNRSDQVRVHLVAEVVANDWVWSLLPKKGVAYYRHLAGFWTMACWMGVKKLRADRRFIARNLRGLARRVRDGLSGRR